MTEKTPVILIAEVREVRTNLWTVIGIGIVAYAACDMVHEVLGHGVACALTGVPALSLSTVALQTGINNRFVAAAGSIANVFAGLLALALFRRGKAFGAARYFLWLSAALNLLNGTGYLLFSGVLDFGDWAVVIFGFEPHGAWRAMMAAAGAVLYVGAVRIIAAQVITLVRNGEVGRREVSRLVYPAYLAGGLLFVGGAALNRISPRLRFSPGWVAAGLLVALVFIAVLGPGVRLS